MPWYDITMICISCYICIAWLTLWGLVTDICVGTPTIFGSDNGLSPGRRQAIIQSNAGILLIGQLGTNFSEILIGIQTFSFKKSVVCELASILSRPQCVNSFWSLPTDICVSDGIIIGLGNDLLPIRRQAFTSPSDHLLSVEPLATHFTTNAYQIHV